MKIQFVATTTIKNGRIKSTSIDGYTRPNLSELDPTQPIANSLRTIVNGYVRDRVIEEGQCANTNVRSRVTYNRKNALLGIEVKIIEVIDA